MSATTHNTEHSHAHASDIPLSPAQIGMIAFLVSEFALFSTLIVAYLTFLGKDKVGPTPAEALSLPITLISSVFLLSSSATIYYAEKALHAGKAPAFHAWLSLTILLGGIFLAGTAYEWNELIRVHQLTISRNLFGTTFYTLIGFHGLHVTAGLTAMLVVLGLSMRSETKAISSEGVELVSWYWHFVDAVWIVVFSVVYLWGR